MKKLIAFVILYSLFVVLQHKLKKGEAPEKEWLKKELESSQ